MTESKYEDTLNRLSGYFDALYEYLSDDEQEDMNDLEDEIGKIIRDQEEEIQELVAQIEEMNTMAEGDRFGD